MSNSRDFSGKVVIVTGSTSGIGEGIAIYLSKLGANVVITGRRGDELKRVAKLCESESPKQLKPLEVIADITIDEDVKRLIDATVAQFGQIDVLVNNAGAAWLTNIYDEKLMDTYEKIMRLNVRAVVYLTHLAVPYLEKTKGNIVNISSVGALKPFNRMTPKCMANAAQDMFAKCLAIELGPKGVRVNAINVGAVQSNFVSAMGYTDKVMKKWMENFSMQNPLRVYGKPSHIANTVAFLASNEAQFITGICIVADAALVLS